MLLSVEQYTIMSSPVGELLLGASAGHLCFAGFGTKALQEDFMHRATAVAVEDNPVLKLTAGELRQYFHGRCRHFTMPINYHDTPFRQAVWKEMQKISYGKTKSYADIAEKVGGRQKARAVGGAAHHNPLVIIIPCHRVIGSDGSLVGFGSGLAIKKKLLELEGKIDYIK